VTIVGEYDASGNTSDVSVIEPGGVGGFGNSSFSSSGRGGRGGFGGMRGTGRGGFNWRNSYNGAPPPPPSNGNGSREASTVDSRGNGGGGSGELSPIRSPSQRDYEQGGRASGRGRRNSSVDRDRRKRWEYY